MTNVIKYSIKIKSENTDRIESLADTLADLAGLSCIREYVSYRTQIKGYMARRHLFPNVENTGEMELESTWDVRDTIDDGPQLEYGERIIFKCSLEDNPEDNFSVELLKDAYLILHDRGKIEFYNQTLG